MGAHANNQEDEMASVVQVELQSGTTRRTCWLSREKKFKVGDAVTLKNSEEPTRLWAVRSVSEPKDAGDIHADWKVGGL